MSKPIITTKTGDDGTTSFIKDIRVSKDSPIVNCLGDIDELNATLGMIKDPDDNYAYERVQRFLIQLSGFILYSNTDIDLVEEHVAELEKEIEFLKTVVDIPTKFIIPHGYIHLARAVCRRAERSLVKLDSFYYDRSDLKVCIKYLNRLSDLLFIDSFETTEKDDLASKIIKAEKAGYKIVKRDNKIYYVSNIKPDVIVGTTKLSWDGYMLIPLSDEEVNVV